MSTFGTNRRLLRVILALAATLALSSCSVEETLQAPWCSGGSSLIAAQSVPTAQLLPCLEGLPDGWSLRSVSVTQSGTVVRLDSDRAGEGAATFRFTETCDTTGAASRPSRFEDRELFEATERIDPSFQARSYVRFDGGCVTWRFDFDRGASATESVALQASLNFVTRSEVNEGIRLGFIDEEL